jgi:hypothetical protein
MMYVTFKESKMARERKYGKKNHPCREVISNFQTKNCEISQRRKALMM